LCVPGAWRATEALSAIVANFVSKAEGVGLASKESMPNLSAANRNAAPFAWIREALLGFKKPVTSRHPGNLANEEQPRIVPQNTGSATGPGE